MHYSPVRRSSAPEGLLPLDLHVLSLPPAFNLSHDQTLQLKVFRLAEFANLNLAQEKLTSNFELKVLLENICSRHSSKYPHELLNAKF